MFGQVFGDDVPDFADGHAGALWGTGARDQRRHGSRGERDQACQQRATDFERIFSGNVIAVLYIVSSLRELQWLLRQTKNWSGKRFFQIE